MQNNSKNIQNKYADIINLPHHISPNRPQMAIADRAAQFSPFAALTGYDTAIEETGRLTDSFIELDENRKSVLNEKLQLILEHIKEQPEVTITSFQPDSQKEGGEYINHTGQIRKIDDYEQVIVMMDGTKISIEKIYDIQCEKLMLSY